MRTPTPWQPSPSITPPAVALPRVRHASVGSIIHRVALVAVFVSVGAAYATHQGVLGWHLPGPPVWFYAAAASAGGVVFFLAAMLFGNEAVNGGPPPAGEDARPLVLYLRPFDVDLRVLQLLVGGSCGMFVWLATVRLGAVSLVFWPLALLPLVANLAVEQRLHHELIPFGRLVAFGEPKRRLQPVGAWRQHYGEEWKREIVRYLSDAALVIVRPGTTDSIALELDEVLERVPADRLLFVLRFRGGKAKRQSAWDELRPRVKRSRLAVDLPESPGAARYLVIDAEGTPRLVDARDYRDTVLRFFFRGELSRDDLRPVLQILGIDLPPPPSDRASHLSRLYLRCCVYIFDSVLVLALWVAQMFAQNYVLTQLARL
ncbi:MAG TPA: hypothetical protein VGB15_14445 [Longimicrobium sp.]